MQRSCSSVVRPTEHGVIVTKVSVEPLRRASDARGFVFEPLNAAELGMQRNVHVVLTEPQQIRGNHFHTNSIEVTAVAGPALVRYREDGLLHTVDVPADETWRFVFPPGVTHAFQNPGTRPLVIVSFNSLPHDPAIPDTTRDVIL
jgi:dTDP-4-dehydrorhamnose 3,5-epimerase-like enzyme